MQLVSAFLIQVLVLRIIGAGPMTDAFIAAQTIPLIVASIIGTALQNIWQPRMAVADGDWPTEVGRAITMTLAVVLPVVAILLGLTPLVMRWLFLGFTPEQVNLTVNLTRINLIGMTFNIILLIVAAGGRARARFLLVELVPAAVTLLALAAIVILLPHTGIEGAAWILAIRAMASFTLLWMALDAPMPCDPRDASLGATSRAAFALMGGSSFYKLGPLVDRFWGSQAPAGQMTLFNLAQTGVGALASLLERALALPIVPGLARALRAKDYTEVRRIYRNALMLVWTVVAVVVICGAIVMGVIYASVAALLGINTEQVYFLIYSCFALTGFLGVAAGGIIINSVFYAMGDVRTPISVGTAGFFLGLIIKSAAFISTGLLGMALGTSIYYVVTMIVMVSILERRLSRCKYA